MASKKKTEAKTRPAPRDMTEVAREIEVTSSDSRFSTYERIPGKNGDGDLILEHRGEPDSKTPPGDA